LRALRGVFASAVIVLASVAQPVQAQVSTRQISLPNQDYTETTQDLVVQAIGGPIVINRAWTWGRWYLNDRWADLIIYPDPMGGVAAVDRADRIYTRLSTQTNNNDPSAATNPAGVVTLPRRSRNWPSAILEEATAAAKPA